MKRILALILLVALLAVVRFTTHKPNPHIGATWLIWAHQNDNPPELSTPEMKAQIAQINRDASNAIHGLTGKELVTSP